MKTILKSLIVAFSMYSKIPMPRFTWNSRDMEYHLCFFPLVGAVIGIAELLWVEACAIFGATPCMTRLFAIAIPLLVTGGFHVDGFMDTMDAVHSYQSREKKLEILKDPHIGAFSVISVIIYFLLAIAFCFEVKTPDAVISVCLSFVLSRILSGLSVILFPKAKNEGMLAVESKTNGKKPVAAVLIIELCAVLALLVCLPLGRSFCGIAAACSFVFSFTYYYFTSKKNFGGITGDLAGFFVCFSELAALAAVAICSILEAKWY